MQILKCSFTATFFVKGEKPCMLTNTWDTPQKKGAGPICIDTKFQDSLLSERAEVSEQQV